MEKYMKLSPVLFFFYLTKISSEIGILHLEDTILRTQTQEKNGGLYWKDRRDSPIQDPACYVVPYHRWQFWTISKSTIPAELLRTVSSSLQLLPGFWQRSISDVNQLLDTKWIIVNDTLYEMLHNCTQANNENNSVINLHIFLQDQFKQIIWNVIIQ